ncbi:MAG: TRAP transporter small permease [Desulfatitalea sp.]|nr:TRAP transporter small permease [Desulfatitalea sp.]
MISRLDKFTETALRTIHYFGMVFVVLMMLLTTVHAAGRYFLGLPVQGLVELSGYMLVTMIFLTVPYTAMVKGHIAIGVIVDRLPLRIQAAIDIFTHLPCLALSILAAYRTFIRGAYILQEGQVSTILGIANAPFVFIVACGWALFACAILMHTLNALSKVFKK